MPVNRRYRPIDSAGRKGQSHQDDHQCPANPYSRLENDRSRMSEVVGKEEYDQIRSDHLAGVHSKFGLPLFVVPSGTESVMFIVSCWRIKEYTRMEKEERAKCSWGWFSRKDILARLHIDKTEDAKEFNW